MSVNDGGPAFPHPINKAAVGMQYKIVDGMSLREYACIHLRIPETGKEWLDEIIRKSQANEFAGQALSGLAANGSYFDYSSVKDAAIFCRGAADAMLAELEKEKI